MVNIRKNLEELARLEAKRQGTPDKYEDAYVVGRLGAQLAGAFNDMRLAVKWIREGIPAEEIIGMLEKGMRLAGVCIVDNELKMIPGCEVAK